MMLRGLTATFLAVTVTGLCVAAAVSAADILRPSSTAIAATAAITPAATAAAPSLHVSGNSLVNAHGARVVLHGVDRSGSEFACVQGWGIFDGAVNQAAVTAMKTWKINAVRVPLNEACWNGESYVDSKYRGASYRKAVEAYVSLLNRNGLVVIVDLHWTDGAYTGPSSGCATARALCQKPMPDTAESVPFWRSVAATFNSNDAVVFDLFNEPYPESATGATESEAWRCWRAGGHCAGISYPVAGMQTLVTTVRDAGAKNVIMLGGLGYASDLSEWLRTSPPIPITTSPRPGTPTTSPAVTAQLLERPGRPRPEESAPRCRGDRRERLRRRLHRPADDLARRPALAATWRGRGTLTAAARPEPDHQLQRQRDRLRQGLPRSPALAAVSGANDQALEQYIRITTS